jgi:hypothetical protein
MTLTQGSSNAMNPREGAAGLLLPGLRIARVHGPLPLMNIIRFWKESVEFLHSVHELDDVPETNSALIPLHMDQRERFAMRRSGEFQASLHAAMTGGVAS